jgi:hypothetical protein
MFAPHMLPRAPAWLRARFEAEKYQKTHQDYGFCRWRCQIERVRALPARTEYSQGARARFGTTLDAGAERTTDRGSGEVAA